MAQQVCGDYFSVIGGFYFGTWWRLKDGRVTVRLRRLAKDIGREPTLGAESRTA
jgi:hypothetical protein